MHGRVLAGAARSDARRDPAASEATVQNAGNAWRYLG
jgi:hypothetical protein